MQLRVNIETIKPYFYQFLGRVLPQLVGIGVSSVIVLNAGIEVFGQYALLFALIAVTFSVLGSALDTNYQRSCMAEEISVVLSSKIVAWTILLPIIVIGSLSTKFAAQAFLFLAVGVLIQHFIETRAIRDRILGNDIGSVFPRLLPVLVFLCSLYLIKPESIESIAGLFALSWSFSLVFLFSLFRELRINVTDSLHQIRTVAPIWLSLIMTQVYGNIDLYIIKAFHSDVEVGVYKLAYTFAGMAMPVAGVFSFIFLSKISEVLSGDNYVGVKSMLRQQIFINTVLGLGLIVFMLVLFPMISDYLYGDAGVNAVTPARILAIAMTLNMLAMVFTYALLAIHKEKVIAIMTSVGAIVYVVSSLVLVPKYAGNGAAVAMVLTYLFLLIAYYYFWRNNTHSPECIFNTNKWIK